MHWAENLTKYMFLKTVRNYKLFLIVTKQAKHMKNLIVIFIVVLSAFVANAQRLGIEVNRIDFKNNSAAVYAPNFSTIGLSYSRKIIPIVGLHLAGSVNYGNTERFGAATTNGSFTENTTLASAQARVEWRPLYGFIVHPIIGYGVGFTNMTQNITSTGNGILSALSDNTITKGAIFGIGAKLFGIRFDLTSSITKGNNPLNMYIYQSNEAKVADAYKIVATPLALQNYTLRVSFPLNGKDKKQNSKMRN
jgi:hypothetical protein